MTFAATSTPCELREASGRLLGSGSVMLTTHTAGKEYVVVALPRPGHVIQRCLVEGLQDVLVSIGQAAEQPARVDRLTFSPDYGRVCVLCLPALPAALGVGLSIR
jgi:hypothetical protein